MRIFGALLICLFCASAVLAQESPEPAAGFERLVRSCDDAQTVIDAERRRLGANFEKELLKYLGNDVEKHYRVAGHVSSCCRKQDDKSLDLLSLTIMQQALSLLSDKKDEHSLYTTVTLRILSAVQSEQLGFQVLAIAHKSEAEKLVTQRPILRGGSPAMEKGSGRSTIHYRNGPSFQTLQRSAGAGSGAAGRCSTSPLLFEIALY